MIKNSSYKRFSATLIVIVILSVLVIPVVSALDFDNVKNSKDTTFDGKHTQGNQLLEKYKPIQIKNAFGLGATIFEGYLSQHDDTCGIDCSSTMEIKLYEDRPLIDDVDFYTILEDGNKNKQNVRSYQFKYWGTINDYETICSLEKPITSENGTIYTPQTCSQVLTGSHEGWVNYILGTEMPKGEYTIKLDAEKKPSRSVDWIIKTGGKTLNEWATWGNISTGDDAEVILNSPVDNYILLSNPQTFNASANVTGGATLTNMSLWTNESGIWEIKNSSNITNIFLDYDGTEVSYTTDGSYVFRKNMTDINHDVSYGISAVKISSSSADPSRIMWIFYYDDDTYENTTYLAISSTSYVNVTMTNPNQAKTVSYIEIYIARGAGSGTVYEDETYVYALSVPSYTKIWTRQLTEPTLWTVQACDSDGDCGFATANRTLLIDTTIPTINIISGNGTQNYGSTSINHTLNYTVTDTNLNSCWINYNSTNRTIPCTSGAINSTNFTLQSGLYTATIYANDSAGNLNTTNINWSYKLLQTAEYFVTSTTSGATNPFNITLDSNSQITIAYLNYNNTATLGSIASSGDTYVLSRDQLATGVSTDTNISFFWNLTRADGFNYITTAQNQTVSPIVINETCTGMYTIFNFTLVDELTQVKINATSLNSSIKTDLTLYTSNGATSLSSFSHKYTATNPAAICLDNNLSNGESYLLDLQVQYSTDNHSEELYHIEDYALNLSSLYQNITLYDLPTTSAQKFELLVRDTSYIPIDGALIKIDRKYIENGSFYTTEIPKTDAKGITSASLETDDVIYNFYIYENGDLISTFEDVLAICQTPLVSTCSIDFNAFQTGISIPNFEDGDDFNFTLGYNSTSKIVSSTFLIPSGEPSTIKLEVISEDTLGTSICEDTLTSASGTLTCIVPNSFGNSTVLAKIYKTGVEQGRGNIKLDQSSSDIFGPILIMLSVLVMLTLIGIGISDNPIVSAVFLFVGVLLLLAMNLVQSTGFYGAGATILFLGVAIILVIVKAGRRT